MKRLKTFNRSVWRRHPTSMQLMAWHDGELPGRELTLHVQRCGRCWKEVASLAAVDAAVREDAGVPSPRDAGPATTASRPDPAPARQTRLARALAVALVVALLAVTLGPGVQFDLGRTSIARAVRAASGPDGTTVTRPPAPEGAPTTTTPSTQASTATNGPVDNAGTGGPPRKPASAPSTLPQPAAPVPEDPLVLGLPLPRVTQNLADREDVIRSVQSVIEVANAAGGIGGRAVKLRIVDADTQSVPADVDVLVGGMSGAAGPDVAPQLSWLLPADGLALRGNAVSLEPDPATAGAIIAATLASTVAAAVLDDGGSQVPFGDSIAAARKTVARLGVGVDDTCDRQILSARRAGATALALALDERALPRCLAAVGRAAWAPPGGILVPTYAAYRPGLNTSGLGLQTVLGAPWPASADEGARRFRDSAKASSYAGLVSFAAAELAIAVARSNGGIVNAATARNGSWRTDLIVLEAGTNVALRVVRARAGGWEPIT